MARVFVERAAPAIIATGAGRPPEAAATRRLVRAKSPPVPPAGKLVPTKVDAFLSAFQGLPLTCVYLDAPGCADIGEHASHLPGLTGRACRGACRPDQSREPPPPCPACPTAAPPGGRRTAHRTPHHTTPHHCHPSLCAATRLHEGGVAHVLYWEEGVAPPALPAMHFARAFFALLRTPHVTVPEAS